MHQIILRRSDDTDIDGDGFVVTYMRDIFFFYDAQKMYLRLKGHFANFVKKERPSGCLFKISFSGADSACKGPSFMAKKFTCKQAWSHGSAVYF